MLQLAKLTATALRKSPDRAAALRRLDGSILHSSLVRARLVNTDQSVPALHAYAGEDPARDGIVDSLARIYRDEPIKIMQLMTANAIERLRTSTIRAFADAFVVRKDKGRG